MRLFTPLLLILILCAPGAAAEPPELVTDRPDQTESTDTVARGSVQTELGFGDADGSDSTATGLVRIGLAERIELRLGLDEAFLGGPDDALDLSVGAKWRLVEEEGSRPAISLLAAVNQRVGDSLSPGSDGLRPSFRFAFSQRLSERLSLGYNAGIAWDERFSSTGMPATVDTDLLSRFLWTAALGIGATERVSFFVEAFGDAGLSDDGPVESGLDGGITWLLRPNIQLDLFIGTGIADASPDWFGGAGVSFRLPD